jgi:hypothetical protein
MKLKSICLVATLVALLVSCDGESTTTNHLIYFPLPSGVAYSDQTADTLAVQCTDSWTVTTTDVTADNWFSPKEFSYTIENGHAVYVTKVLVLDVNATGAMRRSTFTLKSNGKTITKSYVQVPWMNVTRPMAQVRRKDGTVTSLYDDEHFDELMAYFYFSETEEAGSDSIELVLYSRSAKVATAENWIELQDGEGNYVTSVEVSTPAESPTTIKIPFRYLANSTDSKRQGKIVITTSNGVTQEISVIQDAKQNK